MKPTTIIAFLAANFMVANAASTTNQIVIDLSNNDDVPSFHNDADFPDGSGLFNTDNSVNSYEVNDFSDNHVDEPDCYKTITRSSGNLLFEIYDSSCPLIGFKEGPRSGSLIYKFNCCGRSRWIRFNSKDWSKLMANGKLEGARVGNTYAKNGRRYFDFYKIVKNEPKKIAPVDFF